MSQRFIYSRMSGRDLSAALHELDMPPEAFARVFGVRIEVVMRWLKDQQDVPPWVFVATWLMREIPAGVAVARTAAANHIVQDLNFPQRGEYPYLKIPDDREDSA